MSLATQTQSRALSGVALIASLVAVTALSFSVSNDSFVDAALPLYAAAIAVIAHLEGRRFGEATLAFAIPLVAVWRIGVADENLRLFLYGITLAVAAGLFAVRAMARGERLRLGEALVLVAACTVAMRVVPLEVELAPALAIVLGGALLLVASLAGRDGISAGALVVCLAAGLVTPLAPMKATLFPLLVASVLAVVRGPSPFSVAAIVGLAVVSGRWAWPMAALTLASGMLAELVEPMLDRRRQPANAALAAVPPWTGSLASGAVAALAWSPESAFRLPQLARPARIAAVALVGASLVLRPALATLYMIAALAIVLADESTTVGRGGGCESGSAAVPLVVGVVSIAMLSLYGFSGSVASRFPLPLSLAELAAVAVVALAAMPARRVPALAAAASAVALVASVVIAWGEASLLRVDARAALSAGEAFEVDVPPGSELRVELSGGNLTALEPGTPVGTLEAIDRAGGVVRRDIVVGDLADWGLGRRGHHFAARNEWPVSTGGKVREYGNQAFLEGSGTVRLAMPEIARLRITASLALPSRGRLNLESVSVVSR